MSIGGGASSGQSNTQLDPQIKGDWQQVYDLAQRTANGATPQQHVADLTDLQDSAINGMGNAVNVGSGAIQQAIGRANDVSKNPLMVSGVGAGASRYDPATMNAAQLDLSNVPRFQTADIPGVQNKDGYFNLFDQNVTKPVLDAIDLQRQRSINGNTSSALLQGGEGAGMGARAGVSDALTNEAAQHSAGQAVSALALPAFQTSTGLMEQDLGRLSGEKMNASNNVFQGQLANLTAEQQAAAANAGALNTAGQFNANSQNDTSRFNATQQQNAQLANQGALLAGQGQELQSAQLLGQLGGQQQNQYLTGLTAAMTGGNAQQQNQQQQLDANYTNAMNQRNLPLQTLESAFGIIPSTGSGSVTHSSGKSANAGIGG
jgi:hypothetical protein